MGAKVKLQYLSICLLHYFDGVFPGRKNLEDLSGAFAVIRSQYRGVNLRKKISVVSASSQIPERLGQNLIFFLAIIFRLIYTSIFCSLTLGVNSIWTRILCKKMCLFRILSTIILQFDAQLNNRKIHFSKIMTRSYLRRIMPVKNILSCKIRL